MNESVCEGVSECVSALTETENKAERDAEWCKEKSTLFRQYVCVCMFTFLLVQAVAVWSQKKASAENQRWNIFISSSMWALINLQHPQFCVCVLSLRSSSLLSVILRQEALYVYLCGCGEAVLRSVVMRECVYCPHFACHFCFFYANSLPLHLLCPLHFQPLLQSLSHFLHLFLCSHLSTGGTESVLISLNCLP